MDLKQNKFYKIKSIKSNEVLYMNYGLMENIIIKIISMSLDGNTIYIEVPDLKRKLALSKELINDLELIELIDEFKYNNLKND
ncbi:MAG: hypothetical protein N2485_00995 [bacterium]|nr:hypothetical protein [bacterium]